MHFTTPEWVKHAVFYQILPDRFARSPRLEHPRGIAFKPWGSPPEEQGFQGGDLLGIVDKLDYLQELGVTALYLNPIFASASNHRYHPYDYFQVDPLLGGNAALRELLDSAHERKMYVVLDGVFNHASRGFWPFHHVLECGENSPYIDWFIINDWPLRPYSSSKKKPQNYASWWNLPALPKLNTKNPGVREMIFEIARYWLEFGIDGWRLDVPEEIDDDDFWREFRQVVKSANAEVYICGEIWDNAQRWLQGDMFDAVMNYLFTSPALSFFGAKTLRPEYKRHDLALEPLSAEAFARKIDAMHSLYDWEINHAQLNLLGSHDMARALWIMGEDRSALRLCALFQMTMPGAPCIYYGDEIGLSAGDDPHCRAAFPWQDERQWDHALLAFYRKATGLRHRYTVLRTGTFHYLFSENGTYAFLRKLDRQEAIILFNTNLSESAIKLNASRTGSNRFTKVWPLQDRQSVQVENEHLTILVPGREAVVLLDEHGE
ncbi:MAG: glycoside hydrolase family 13 protein [bacterium]